MILRINVRLVILASFAIPLFLLGGCGEDEEQKEPPKLNHKNAVEYYVTTTRENSLLVITTKKDIYNNYKLLSSITTKDTLPDLGTESVSTEDEEGNQVQKTEPIAYDIYFHSERK